MSPLDTALAASRARIGEEIGLSPWVTVDQAMIDAFAACTLDDQFIHVDPARARAETPFGGTIAHGFLTLSLASRFAYDALQDLPGQRMGVNYGFERVRFLAPVPAGARLRGRFTLRDASARPGGGLLRKWALSIEIEGAKGPALAADWLTLIYFDAR